MTKKDGHGLAAYGYKIFFKSSQRGKIENKTPAHVYVNLLI